MRRFVSFSPKKQNNVQKHCATKVLQPGAVIVRGSIEDVSPSRPRGEASSRNEASPAAYDDLQVLVG